MSEKKKKGPSKKRSKKSMSVTAGDGMSKKQAQITAFTIGILFILLPLVIFYLYFYLEAHILFIFPGLAKEVTFTDLLESPNAYENEWIKIKGRLQYTFSQRMANAAELLPGYYPTQPGDSDIWSRQGSHNKDSEENYFKILLEAVSDIEDTSFRFSSVAPGNIVEVVGASKGLDKDYKNVMKLKVVKVVGYIGLSGWVSFFYIILIAIGGFVMGFFFIRGSLRMAPKKRHETFT